VLGEEFLGLVFVDVHRGAQLSVADGDSKGA
jgi:hypothetical protein